jgi:hypothetical protein
MTENTATAPAYTIPEGYNLKWERPSFHLLVSDGSVEGASKWLVACVKHGATTPADTLTKADLAGRKADRATWCEGCKADMASAPAPAAPGTIRVNINLTVEVAEAKWAGEPADLAKLVKAIQAQTGATDEAAAELAKLVVGKTTDIRGEVRDHVLAHVQGMTKIKDTGAIVTLRGAEAKAAETPAS